VDEFASVCEEIARHNGRIEKTRILAEYLRSLNDADFVLAVLFLSSGPRAPAGQNHSLFGIEKQRKLSIGYSILREALQAATVWDRETLSICHSVVGDTGETIGLLMKGQSSGEPLDLATANTLYQQLFDAVTTAQKRDLLVAIFRGYRPGTIKYFVKVITRNLRIGLLERMVEDAVAVACDIEPPAVRDANSRLGDLAQVALAARQGRLASIEVRLFHPVEFMLAKPLDRLEDLANPDEWLLEDKYDGIRSQVHFDEGQVQIFSRSLEEITTAFPEIAKAFEGLAGNGLIDGEVLAWRDGRALSFNMLQQRIARKRVRASLQQEIPVVFIAYDILLRNNQRLMNCRQEERRDFLEQTLAAAQFPILLSAWKNASTISSIEESFTEARARGNEGLLLKRKGTLYEPGRRGGAWLKLKRPYGTLDVVITAAEPGQGRRAIFLSDYTFGVRSENGFVNVGKAYSGLTDSEVKELTRVLRAASTEKFGRVLLVKPQVVLEVAFDGVQKSPRHKAGYALRFPRILRWRRDKKPEECDELSRVEQLYQASIV
jgi:DNA ligase-1